MGPNFMIISPTARQRSRMEAVEHWNFDYLEPLCCKLSGEEGRVQLYKQKAFTPNQNSDSYKREAVSEARR